MFVSGHRICQKLPSFQRILAVFSAENYFIAIVEWKNQTLNQWLFLVPVKGGR